MVQSRPVAAPETVALRAQLRAAQDGSAAAYREVLSWAASRAHDAFADLPDPDPVVRAALTLLHGVRHTYDPVRDPVRWVDSVLAMARAAAAAKAGPQRASFAARSRAASA